MAKNKNIKKRTEKHIIKQTDKYYSLLMSFCHLSKNLYNHANHIMKVIRAVQVSLTMKPQ